MSKINQKILLARKRMLECDWTTDAQYQRPGPRGVPQTIHYVSADKIKRNYVPLFADIGLDYKVEMKSILPTEKGGYTLRADVILTDLESDESDITSLISDAPTQDKGCSIALTNVMRMYFSSRFGIVDGIEYEGEENDYAGSLNKMLSSKAIEPKSVEVSDKNSTATIPEIPPEPKNIVQSVSNTPVKKVSKLSAMEEKACHGIMAYLDQHKDSMSPELYERAKTVFDMRSESSDVMELMEIKRDVESKQKAVTEGM